MSRTQSKHTFVEHLTRRIDVRHARLVATIIILVLTLTFITMFFIKNPAYMQQLRHAPLQAVAAVVLLNLPAMVALTWAYDAILRLCGKPLRVKENALLTAYSSIVNFFGPLESGPAVRTVYLKTRHGVRIRDYTLATLLYLALFAGFSALFLLIGVRPWWQTGVAIVAVGMVSVGVIRWFFIRERKGSREDASLQFRLRAGPLACLIIAVFLQLSFIAAYFYVELRAVDQHISIGQAISYAGAANFSLFVSLTPDAIGIREAFLIFSQSIHHVSTGDIVNANIIDRIAYIIYLLLTLMVVLAVHARDQLKISGWRHVK